MLSNIIGGLIILVGVVGLFVWIYIASLVLNKDPIKRDVGLIGPMLGVFATVLFRSVYERFDNAIVFYGGVIILIFLFYFIFTSDYKIKNTNITRLLNILALIGLLVFVLFIIRAGWYKIFAENF